MSFSVLVILVMIALYIPASNTDFYTHHAGLQDLHQGTAGIVHDCIVFVFCILWSFQYIIMLDLKTLWKVVYDECIVNTIRKGTEFLPQTKFYNPYIFVTWLCKPLSLWQKLNSFGVKLNFRIFVISLQLRKVFLAFFKHAVVYYTPFINHSPFSNNLYFSYCMFLHIYFYYCLGISDYLEVLKKTWIYVLGKQKQNTTKIRIFATVGPKKRGIGKRNFSSTLCNYYCYKGNIFTSS